MKISNLTRPNKEPQDGDLLKYEYDDGIVEVKYYYSPVEPTVEEIADAERQWRNGELSSTDWIVPIIDHPKHSAYMTYRQELRDYPAQEDFPNGQRPIKP